MGLFDLPGGFRPALVAGVRDSRFIEPHDCEEINEWRVKYDNAQALANDLGTVPQGFRAFCILDGKFIFGDLIEALIVNNNWRVDDLTISTLSMSQDNIDSLRNLLDGDYLCALNIIVSHYYYATERGGLMPYLYETLDINNMLQLAVASVHTKIAMIRTECGKKIVIHGSANLRSSSNVEQIVVEHSSELYAFCYNIHKSIVREHKTINKAVRRTNLWRAILRSEEPWQADQAGKVEVSDSPNTGKKSQQQKEESRGASGKAGI